MAEAPSSRRSSRFSMRSKQLGQLLQESGEVQAEHIAKALKLQEQQGGLIGQILRSMGVCSPEGVKDALLKQVQVTDVHCEDVNPAPEVLALVSREQSEADKLCPFEKISGLLCVVMGNPLNRRAINAIEEQSKVKVKPFKAPWPKIKELIERSYTDENMAAAQQVFEGDAEDAVGTAIDGLDAAPLLEIAPPDELAAPEEEVAEAAAVAEPEAPAEPVIDGLDNLDDTNAEVIETDKRGLTRKKKVVEDEPVPQYKHKVAKVNVDLDNLDIATASEVVGSKEDREEAELEEIAPGAAPKPAAAKPVAKSIPRLPVFEVVPDAYFYAEDAAPEEGSERSEELLSQIEQLPVAEVAADSAHDYHLQQEAKKKAAAPAAPKLAEPPALKPVPAPAPKPAAPPKKKVSVETMPAPAGPVAAVPLSDAEWIKIAASLTADPVGEWDWAYAAPGPVPVVAFEAENA